MLTCYNCKGDIIVIHESKGEAVCIKCGHVVQEKRESSSEERTFEDEVSSYKGENNEHMNSMKKSIMRRLQKEEHAFLCEMKSEIERIVYAMFNDERTAVTRRASEYCEEAYRIQLAQKRGDIKIPEKQKENEEEEKEEEEEEGESEEERDRGHKRKMKERMSRKARRKKRGMNSSESDTDSDVEIIAVIEADRGDRKEKNRVTLDPIAPKRKKNQLESSSEEDDLLADKDYEEPKRNNKNREKVEKGKRVRHSPKILIVVYALIKTFEELNYLNAERRRVTISDINKQLPKPMQLHSVLEFDENITHVKQMWQKSKKIMRNQNRVQNLF